MAMASTTAAPPPAVVAIASTTTIISSPIPESTERRDRILPFPFSLFVDGKIGAESIIDLSRVESLKDVSQIPPRSLQTSTSPEDIVTIRTTPSPDPSPPGKSRPESAKLQLERNQSNGLGVDQLLIPGVPTSQSTIQLRASFRLPDLFASHMRRQRLLEYEAKNPDVPHTRILIANFSRPHYIGEEFDALSKKHHEKSAHTGRYSGVSAISTAKTGASDGKKKRRFQILQLAPMRFHSNKSKRGSTVSNISGQSSFIGEPVSPGPRQKRRGSYSKGTMPHTPTKGRTLRESESSKDLSRTTSTPYGLQAPGEVFRSFDPSPRDSIDAGTSVQPQLNIPAIILQQSSTDLHHVNIDPELPDDIYPTPMTVIEVPVPPDTPKQRPSSPNTVKIQVVQGSSDSLRSSLAGSDSFRSVSRVASKRSISTTMPDTGLQLRRAGSAIRSRNLGLAAGPGAGKSQSNVGAWSQGYMGSSTTSQKGGFFGLQSPTGKSRQHSYMSNGQPPSPNGNTAPNSANGERRRSNRKTRQNPGKPDTPARKEQLAQIDKILDVISCSGVSQITRRNLERGILYPEEVFKAPPPIDGRFRRFPLTQIPAIAKPDTADKELRAATSRRFTLSNSQPSDRGKGFLPIHKVAVIPANLHRDDSEGYLDHLGTRVDTWWSRDEYRSLKRGYREYQRSREQSERNSVATRPFNSFVTSRPTTAHMSSQITKKLVMHTGGGGSSSHPLGEALDVPQGNWFPSKLPTGDGTGRRSPAPPVTPSSVFSRSQSPKHSNIHSRAPSAVDTSLLLPRSYSFNNDAGPSERSTSLHMPGRDSELKSGRASGTTTPSGGLYVQNSYSKYIPGVL
ncbi:hypothetical protein HDU76_002565 [Blyttiomyces sp. JEL0837]|nr:hypothetical protein HDU76_002565 [Blyttiomyces sp. JEL0837]